MEALTKIVQIIGTDFYLILLLALSWIPLYFLFDGLELLARKLLFRIPFYLQVKKKRHELKVSDLHDQLSKGGYIDHRDGKLITELGEFYSCLDKKLSKIQGGQHWLSKALKEKSIDVESKNIERQDLLKLETDYALCQVVLGNEKTSKKGLLYFIGSQQTEFDETLEVLFYALKFAPADTQPLARYHLESSINTRSKLERVEHLISGWSGPIRQFAEQTTGEIKHRLQLEEANH